MMKTLFSIVFLGMLLIISSNCFAEDAVTKRVLFLGNSVFYSRGGLCPTFEGFCREAGLDYQAVSQWNTPSNPQGVEFLDYGRIPLNLPEVAADAKIHELIRSGNFDYVILEARRPGYLLPESAKLADSYGKPIPYEENLEALDSIHRTIVESGAQTVLYMHPGSHETADINHHVAQIYQRLHGDLEKIRIGNRRHKVTLVPAMLLWLDAIKKFGIENWYADHNHGNALARYASACMVFTYLTGEDPRETDFKELTTLTQAWESIDGDGQSSASHEEAKWIKDQVWLYYSTRPR